MTRIKKEKTSFSATAKNGLLFKDGGTLKCRLQIITTDSGARSVDCNISNSSSTLRNAFGNDKKLYQSAQKMIENGPYEIMETIYEIDQYTRSIEIPTSEGAWNIGRMISEFLDKFPNCQFINLSHCLNAWFKSYERVKFGHTQSWMTFFYFYKTYKLEDIDRVPYYYSFIDRTLKGHWSDNHKIIGLLHESGNAGKFLEWYKAQPSHKIKSTTLTADAQKQLTSYRMNNVTSRNNFILEEKEIETKYR